MDFLNILFVEEIKMEKNVRISDGTQDLKYNNKKKIITGGQPTSNRTAGHITTNSYICVVLRSYITLIVLLI